MKKLLLARYLTQLLLKYLPRAIAPREDSSESCHLPVQVDCHLSPELPGVHGVVAVLQGVHHPPASVGRRSVVAPRKADNAGGHETPQVGGFVELLRHGHTPAHGDLGETLGFGQTVTHGVLPVLSAGRSEEREAALDVFVDLVDGQAEVGGA